MKNKEQLIVITGTQRSGTSFMAKYLKACGYDLGSDFWDDRVAGGFENEHICKFYQRYYGVDFPFRAFWQKITRSEDFYDFKKLHEINTIVKFSYLLMLPEFVRTWYFARGNKDIFIVLNRDKKQVVLSKKSKKFFRKEDWYGLNLTEKQLKTNFQNSLTLMDCYKMKYLVVDFPVTMHLQKIEHFCGIELNHALWDQMYDKTKINNR